MLLKVAVDAAKAFMGHMRVISGQLIVVLVAVPVLPSVAGCPLVLMSSGASVAAIVLERFSRRRSRLGRIHRP